MKGAADLQRRPQAVMLSKRANVFYIEHAKVVLLDDRIVYLTQDFNNRESAQPYFNIPERNTAFLLLGKGTSITDAAARRLAESNVMIGFCGSGGSPLFSAVDISFLSPQSEYRPTEYMQRWMKIWLDDGTRLLAAKALLNERVDLTIRVWGSDAALLKAGVAIPSQLTDGFKAEISTATTAQQLLLAEARWAKALYALLSRGLKFDFVRNEGARKTETRSDIVNGLLDHGNYIAYGYAAVTLCGLGISFALPVLHGKTRRGALVFDIADLIKDAYVMPLAFLSAKSGDRTRDFRAALIERCQDQEVLDHLFTFVSQLCEKS
jgi:CRISPR-associated protein Cas1